MAITSALRACALALASAIGMAQAQTAQTSPDLAKVIADARPYRRLFPLPWPDDFDRYH